LKRDGFNLAIYLEQNKIYQALNNAQAAQTSLDQYQTLASKKSKFEKKSFT
jgi:hypothetical protein